MNPLLLRLEELSKDFNPAQRAMFDGMLNNFIGIVSGMNQVVPAAINASQVENVPEEKVIPGENRSFVIYTDGACSGNPGPGGWGVVITVPGYVRQVIFEDAGRFMMTTNNQMELTAVLSAIHLLPGGSEAIIRTDSQNVIGWLSQGWKRKVPEINELCTKIENAIKMRDVKISFEHVKGHSGDEFNERCDMLATGKATPIQMPLADMF